LAAALLPTPEHWSVNQEGSVVALKLSVFPSASLARNV
jgi:hypothetical protein